MLWHLYYDRRLLADAYEFSELPVRHNEDGLNADLAHTLPWGLPAHEDPGSAHVKTYLLLQVRTIRSHVR